MNNGLRIETNHTMTGGITNGDDPPTADGPTWPPRDDHHLPLPFPGRQRPPSDVLQFPLHVDPLGLLGK